MAEERPSEPALLPLLRQPGATAGRGWQLLLLSVAMGTGAYAQSALGPLQEMVRLDLGLSDNAMAVLQGPALSLPILFLAVPLGLLIDRWSRARLLMILAGLGAICCLATALAGNFALLLAARAVAGLAGIAANPAIFALLADFYLPQQRGRAHIPVAFGQFAGRSLAFAGGGFVVGLLGPAPANWRNAMLLLTIPLALSALLLTCLREPPREGISPATIRIRPQWADYVAIARLTAPLLAGIMAIEVAIGAALIWSAPMMMRAFGGTASAAGGLIAAALLATGLAAPAIAGFLADYCQRTGGPRRTATFLALLSAMGAIAGLYPLAGNAELSAIGLAVFLAALITAAVMTSTLFTIIVPSVLRGTAVSILVALCVLCSGTVGPLTVSLVATASGDGTLAATLAATCAVASIAGAVFFILGRQFLPLPAGRPVDA